MKLKLGKKQQYYAGSYVRLYGTEFFDKTGKRHIWEWFDKSDVVSVLPITNDGKAVLVKNYRVPLEKYVIEPPMGANDKDGENFEEIAKRELLEETGYAADKLTPLPPWPYRSGTSRNMIYGFVATGLKKVNDAAGDDTEDLTVLEVPLKKLISLCLNPPADALFLPEIIAMYEMAKELKIIP